MPYRLSASLHHHASDVRAVASPNDTLVLSASRDATAAVCARTSPTATFDSPRIFQTGNSKYINSVAYIPPSAEVPQGCIVTGGQDGIINVYVLDSPSDEPKYSLIGHLDNVCSLHASASGLLVSGSWDRTARVWRDFQQQYELKHEQSVWAVQIVDEGEESYLTASADKTIKWWMRNKVLRTFYGHKDAVRGLALMPEIGFISCSNDGEVRVWTSEGDTVFTLSGHTSFVYSVAVLPSGEIVSSGEDRTVRVWRDEECIQTLVHPATSVWGVSTMPNGDIVTGSSDGVVRIFSAAEERWAAAEVLKKYDEQISSQSISSQVIGDVKKSDVPGQEALSIPGKASGEVKMVRNELNNVEAYQWDSASNSWQKIGEVVDAVGSGRKQLYQGKEYDYVFDVDIQDGVPPLKLPYSTNENPYTAAQRFLAANDLPMSYIDQVSSFITKNTSGVNLGAGGFHDPYTGASRYKATQNTPVGVSSGSGDPFTGTSRYQPPSVAAPVAAPSTATPPTSRDPFTGGSRYTPSMSSPPRPLHSQSATAWALAVIPVSTFLSFKQGNLTAMRGKIIEFNDAFGNEISTSGVAMYHDELNRLDQVYRYLQNAMSSPDIKNVAPPNHRHLDTISQILERWPASCRFPVIDLGRLVSGFCPLAYEDPAVASQFFISLLKAAEWDMTIVNSFASPPKSRETNVLLALRAITNAFQESTISTASEWAIDLLGTLKGAAYKDLNRSCRVAFATLLFNLSCVRLRTTASPSFSEAHNSLIETVIHEERTDAETVYRALVALGNMLFSLKSQDSKLSAAEIAELRKDFSSLRSTFPEERIDLVLKDIGGLLQDVHS